MSQRGFIRVRFRKKEKKTMKRCNFWLLAISNYFFDGLELPPLSDSFSRISFVLTHATIEYEIVKQNLPGKKGLVCEKTCLLLDILKMLKDEM